jgi:hypothetical protein
MDEKKRKFSSYEYVVIGIFGPFVLILAVISLPFYWLGRGIAKWTGVDNE